MVVPQNGWFIMENLIEMDHLEVPLFVETSISKCNSMKYCSLKFHKVYDLSVVGLFLQNESTTLFPGHPSPQKKTILVVSKTIFRHLYLLLSPILTRMIEFHNSTGSFQPPRLKKTWANLHQNHPKSKSSKFPFAYRSFFLAPFPGNRVDSFVASRSNGTESRTSCHLFGQVMRI